MIKMLTSKPKIVILLIACVLFIVYSVINAMPKSVLPDDVFAFGPTPENGQLGGIEGVYYHRASSLFEILRELSCKGTDGWDNCTTYELLRFYDDGVVIETPIGTDDGIVDADLPKLQAWFNREAKETPSGKYFISGNRIWFSATVHYEEDNRTVTSDFSGFIVGSIVVLDSYSHYSGDKSNKMIFFKLNEDREE